MAKLTKARKRVLAELVRRNGRASEYDLAYPRAHMLHQMHIIGWLDIEGSTDSWGLPTYPDGVYVITTSGRAALQDGQAE